MKTIIFLANLFLLTCANVIPNLHDPLMLTEWDLFKTSYAKQYQSNEEEQFRLKVYLDNKNYIERHNKLADQGIKKYRLAMNQFGDLLNFEFAKQFNGFGKVQKRENGQKFRVSNVNLPKHVDWRTKGYVTAVKNQGQCGSCWAFSTTGSLEGQHFKKTGKLVSLSEQQLVDCSGSYGNMGCEGGLMDNAFNYIRDNKGIDTEESYPYEGTDGDCRFNPQTVGATVTGYVDIPSKDEKALAQAAATVGPISVAIDAGHLSFQFYRSGIYEEPNCSQDALDHGVLVVGFGNDGDGAYWIVKNSWDTIWGDNGYIKMSKDNNNQCGIATKASYPTV